MSDGYVYGTVLYDQVTLHVINEDSPPTWKSHEIYPSKYRLRLEAWINNHPYYDHLRER